MRFARRVYRKSRPGPVRATRGRSGDCFRGGCDRGRWVQRDPGLNHIDQSHYVRARIESTTLQMHVAPAQRLGLNARWARSTATIDLGSIVRIADLSRRSTLGCHRYWLSTLTELTILRPSRVSTITSALQSADRFTSGANRSKRTRSASSDRIAQSRRGHARHQHARDGGH